jgi:hypothetical protein
MPRMSDLPSLIKWGTVIVALQCAAAVIDQAGSGVSGCNSIWSVIVPADGTRAATVRNGDFGTSPIFGQLSDKPLLASLWLSGARVVKNQWQVKKIRCRSEQMIAWSGGEAIQRFPETNKGIFFQSNYDPPFRLHMYKAVELLGHLEMGLPWIISFPTTSMNSNPKSAGSNAAGTRWTSAASSVPDRF